MEFKALCFKRPRGLNGLIMMTTVSKREKLTTVSYGDDRFIKRKGLMIILQK